MVPDLIDPLRALAADVAAMRQSLERIAQTLAAQQPTPPAPPVVALKEPAAPSLRGRKAPTKEQPS